MTRTVLITGTEDSTGKTAIALALGQLAAENGLSVGYMKPRGTRLQSNVGKTIDEDPMLARELLDIEAEMHELEPVVYSPTFIEEAIRGREDSEELRATIRENFEALSEERDLMLVEGASDLDVGGIVSLTDPDLAELLDAEVILVSPYQSAGDTDAVLGAADRLGERLAGVVFNAVGDASFASLESDTVPFLEGRGVPVLGALPRTQELAGVTVSELADELGAELLTSAATDAFVERFLVGAMGGDSALRHFRRARNAALITGGDRSDIQTVALEASGVKCLVLTGGLQPSSAVVGKAEERDVPIMTVRSDTLSTIERAEDVVRRGRTRSPETVARMRALLTDHADTDAILGTE
ncbi:phosphotransacetylase family protein [Halalkalicoccus jeotgali]|uniref:Cobyrinic acid ac-diamide synthase n=1 Tax=Halalkalicoccus jeotgali (strain DSM 18796 / CECT 7217 / JCM 14584 / KCTC 4019 / B3) TaxID=795797 RepID=D8J9Q8_HALJB|nr:phosphotransacetylase family protein [Halalkalicoccus jeotgali]ADJ16397.1 cobyrinic acid ac-diamide synthase [Halalkalicoccus jeotgali B3]ELY37131.1 cobyrinic acid ac-diamide synthase [Halalkalicoccus jeotgali B3]